jgi:translation initiation factor 5A
MVLKIIDAVQAKPGTTVMIDGVACVVKSNDVSKTGKHGHAKCRIEAVGVMDGKKKVIVISGHDRFDVPNIQKDNAQILSVMGDKASVMDLKSFENFELPISEELKDSLKEGDQVEYWDLEGIKFIKRKV